MKFFENKQYEMQAKTTKLIVRNLNLMKVEKGYFVKSLENRD